MAERAAAPSLPQAGDTGKEIFFDQARSQARHIAGEYAKLRWGKMSREKGSSFALLPGKQMVNPKKEQGLALGL